MLRMIRTCLNRSTFSCQLTSVFHPEHFLREVWMSTSLCFSCLSTVEQSSKKTPPLFWVEFHEKYYEIQYCSPICLGRPNSDFCCHGFPCSHTACRWIQASRTRTRNTTRRRIFSHPGNRKHRFFGTPLIDSHLLANVFDAVIKGLQELQILGRRWPNCLQVVPIFVPVIFESFHPVLPSGFREPCMRAGLFGSVQRGVSLHVEVELFLVQVVVPIENHGGHLETEQQLVLFEDPHAGVVVHGLSHLFPQVPEVFLYLFWTWGKVSNVGVGQNCAASKSRKHTKQLQNQLFLINWLSIIIHPFPMSNAAQPRLFNLLSTILSGFASRRAVSKTPR